MSGFASYSVDNDRRFRNAITRAREAVGDLRLPLTLIANDFYRSQRAIWLLNGPGQYPDLAPSTKRQKLRQGSRYYPILKRTGDLEKAASVRGATGNITIIGRSVLAMGVESSIIPYAIYHQSDRPRRKIPQRKFLFIGPEAPRFANSDQRGRLERWLNTINSYVLKVMEREGIEIGNITGGR